MPSLNKDLQSRLKEHFHPLGIVAYSNCCRFGCSGSYNEDDEQYLKMTNKFRSLSFF